jgi:thiamine-phosphate pyrophosphorylase
MQGVYLVTDRELCGERPLEEVVFLAVKGGVTCVQIREKGLPLELFIEQAKKIKELIKPFNVPLIINDNVDVALAVGANGVHVGQSDMPFIEVRRLLGAKAMIGLSIETWEDVEKAQDLDADYLGVSPVFDTPTKTDTKGAWGLDGLSRIKAYSRHKLVAIGGINMQNAVDVIRAGADSIAVVSAICAAPDPYEAACELNNLIRSDNSRL